MNKRRALIAGLTLAILIIAGGYVWRRSAVPAPGSGPIILISIDTLRADRLPAYGYTGTRTPAIDRLAGDGVLFEQAYSHSPQTLPAHTSMLTGKLPFEHGVRDNIGFSVKPGERVLQQALRDRGYVTGAFVSAHVLRHEVGLAQGFDHYDDELPPASPSKPLGQVQRAGLDTWRAAERWLTARTSPRFFLFFHIYEPHRPYSPPSHLTASNPYDGEVEHADEIVGALLEHLTRTDLYDRSTIVLLSDHGEGLGDHGEDEHGIFLYRETIRVPLIVKLPGSREGGRRVASAVQHVDLVPTILELLDGAAGGDEQEGPGRSLLPVLGGAGTLAEAAIYSEALSPRYHFGWSELYALSDDRYRLIRAPRDELYDLSQDPDEKASVAADRVQVTSAMRAVLDRLIANAAPSAPSAISADDRQKLAALGYVGTQSGVSLQLPSDQLPDPKDKIHVLRKYKQAADLGGRHRLAEAAALYRELLRDDPGMTDAWLQLADVLVRRGLTGEALDAYTEVLKRTPKDPAGLTGAASSLLRLGRFREARAHAELATDVAPAIAHELLARIAVHLDEPDEARKQARHAQTADPTLPLPAFIEGLILHKQQQYAQAIPHFRGAAQAVASRTLQVPDLHYYLGDALARLDRFSEAEQSFKAELEIFPQHVRARAGLAMMYRATGRDREAEQAIAELVQQVPTAEGLDVAAQLWTMFGEPDRAARLRAGRRPR
ncbi:MAG TPA: sulfatase-like hydrolase/transferase [Vicinamibacterales bacterium]|nr:sulfatase-like hydrolase/transferase [Vicinamibacterales bacterium]